MESRTTTRMKKAMDGSALIDRLQASIESGNFPATLDALLELEHLVMNDVEYINWVTDPVNITGLHQSLITNMDIPHRLLLLKNRVPNKHRRAIMFVKIMYNAVKRIQEVRHEQ